MSTEPSAAVQLTPTEQSVLRNIDSGLSSSETAAAMNVGKRTVDFHLHNIYTKMQVRNRVQALAYARKHDLL